MRNNDRQFKPGISCLSRLPRHILRTDVEQGLWHVPLFAWKGAAGIKIFWPF